MIAVVGAGLAGLTCAYELAKHGLASTVYEANPDRLLSPDPVTA